MSEETSESYDSGQIVWVKLGSSWWPGEVKNAEELPSDVADFKKPPLVIVKFFEEDSYEYVKTWSNIYPYNCERKNEFIKKGMAAFRSKVPHMEKFPKDIVMAEEKVGGNINILSDPMFLPKKKRDYAADGFGNPNQKPNTSRIKKRSNTGKSNSKKDTSHITHRRFLGVDDYKAIICIQFPGKDRTPGDKEDDEVIRINRESEQTFNCHSCSFSTTRLEVMILHTKSHIQGVYLSSSRKSKSNVYRRKKDKVRRSKGSDSDSSSSDTEPVRQKKRKPKSQSTNKAKVKKVEAEKEKPKEDIRRMLLDSWDESEDNDLDMSFENDKSETVAEASKTLNLSSEVPGESLNITDAPDQNDSIHMPTTDEDMSRSKVVDESGTKSPNQTTGQTLPAVSEDLKQQTETSKSPERQLSTEKLLSTLEDNSVDNDNRSDKEKKKSTKSTQKTEKKLLKNLSDVSSDKSDIDETSSKQIMDKDMHDAIKSCFDFDEDEEEENVIANKTTSGRKIPRVIPKSSRKISSEVGDTEADNESANKPEKDDGGSTEDMDAAYRELLEMTTVPEFPDVRNTLKCEQNFHNIKTIKFPDKSDQVGSPPKADKKESSEVATKLTNPKKRFVKSFEDFELMQNEIRRREEEQHDMPKNDYEETKVEAGSSTSKKEDMDCEFDLVESNIEFSKLKSKIMSKIIEEAKAHAEKKVRKLNQQQDAKVKSEEREVNVQSVAPVSHIKPSESDIKVFSKSTGDINTDKVCNVHRTPRSKILENYRNDTNKHKDEEKPRVPDIVEQSESTPTKSEETVQDRLRDSDTEKDVVPPKKNKWSRRGSHPKKDKKLFMLQDLSPYVADNSSDPPKEKTEEALGTNQTRLDLDSVDSSKINDIILGQPKPALIEDTGQGLEVVEEEQIEPPAEPPVKDTQNVELKQTEIVPSQIDETSDTYLNTNLSGDCGVKEANEDTSSVNKEILETTEVSQEKDSPMDLFRTNSPEEKPSNILGDCSASAVTEEISVNENDILTNTNDTIPEKDSLEVKDINDAHVESNEKENLVEETELHASEDPSNVPSNQTETIDVKLMEPVAVQSVEQVVEEKSILSPVTETYTTLDHPSVGLPEDIIDVPSKRSNKRKMSHTEQSSSPIKIDSETAVQSDQYIPLEKRKKEEESEISQPELESQESISTEKDEAAVCLEEKQDKDISESNESDNKMSLETEQATQLVIQPLPEDNKMPILETKTIVETEKDVSDAVNISEKDQSMDVEENKSDCKEFEPDLEKSEDTQTNNESQLPVGDHNNEVEIQCASSSVDSFKFSIQTNLSILSNRQEDMSALALATLSEIKADLESNESMIPHESQPEPIVPPVLLESEMVPIEGNLTVVSEKDLADGQVEITSEQVISPKRPITLSNFSMDFSDSLSDSNSNSMTDTSSDLGKVDFTSKGTEFNSKVLTKQMKRIDQKKENAYGRLELINILEGNSDTEKKSKEYKHPPKKTNTVDDICDFEEHIPSQIVCAKILKKDTPDPEIEVPKEKEKTSKTSVRATTSKLLERLTTDSKIKTSITKGGILSDSPASEGPGKLTVEAPNILPTVPKNVKYVLKSKSGIRTNKPIILSEQIVKPANDASKLKSKRSMEDIEDVEAFVIHKDPNKMTTDEDEIVKMKTAAVKSTGKAKILQQTIITPAGEIIQPTVTEVQTDDNIFDINSMPIVLSDDILTPESIEKMSIVIGSDNKSHVTEKVVKKSQPVGRIITTVATTQATPNKTVTITKHKQPRILQTVGNKVIKNSPLLPSTAKPGKYIIVPHSSIPQTKYVPKKPVAKKTAIPTGIVQKVPSIAPEPSGNKIMIVTNQQGQQQRLLLTPAQQKMLGYQNQKVTKTIVKGNVMQKSVLATKSSPLIEASTSGVISKTSSLVGKHIVVGTNANQGLITSTHQVLSSQGRAIKSIAKKSPAITQKVFKNVGKPQKTILIKNQHGQTVRRIQGNDDELLDKQVAEQLEAIKASSGMKFSSQPKPLETTKVVTKTPIKRSYTKRVEVKPRGPPPLTGIQQTPKPETVVSMQSASISKIADLIEPKSTHDLLTEETKVHSGERPLNQLVIQDAVGNQTTITEGQILALPSETVDGQPQSYMLVTLDKSGNLTPLNSEALMSLDPSLGLGGDLSNMVLQIDQGAGPQTAIIKTPDAIAPPKPLEVEPTPQPVVSVPELVAPLPTRITETVMEQKIEPPPEAVQPVAPTTNGDPGQQLIVTGDPIATQKFLESLSEGTTDLANILANAEGNSILIQADGQQILINTNTDNQMLLSMSSDNINVSENTEGGGNPIFATQPNKNQDILAAALADTDVFQQDHPSSTQGKIGSQLSPNTTLYPMNVGNVLETSLTLSSPIMTPLEVPSTNNKKIPDDEADILTQVPKNVDLPITITDPNISQTVANQQVSAMIANELQTNLELALPISETSMSTVSTDMNSPSYVYSLPTLDDSVEMTQKPFNGSMPLLNEDIEEPMNKEKSEENKEKLNDGTEKNDKEKNEVTPEGFLAEEEGRFTLGGEMCSSLSEPPPEMFDLPEVNQNFAEKGSTNIPSLQSTPDISDNASKDDDTTDLSTHADTSSEGSCEIPLQPQIVTKSLDLSENLDSLQRSLSDAEGENKKCKFD